MLKIGDGNLQDLLIDLDDYTEYETDIFWIKKVDLLPKTQNRNIVIDLLFEVSLNKKIIIRENYNVLDFLGDIGGV